MPYISPDRREWAPWAEFRYAAEELAKQPELTDGDINWAITTLLTEILQVTGVSYTYLARCVAACECAKLELYRRMMAQREDFKCHYEGDVYPTWLLPRKLPTNPVRWVEPDY